MRDADLYHPVRSAESRTTRRQTGQLVGLTSNGLAVDHVSKADETAYFGDNRHGVWIPVCNGFAASNLLAIAFRQYPHRRRTLLALVRPNSSDQLQLGVTGSNQFTAGVHNRLHVAELDATFVFHLDAGFSSRTRCRTTDVERTHRQLCTRFTDGLPAITPGLPPFVDDVATRQVTTVAVRTQPKSVSQDTTERTFRSTEFFQQVTPLFVQQRVARNEDIRQNSASEWHSTQDPVRLAVSLTSPPFDNRGSS